MRITIRGRDEYNRDGMEVADRLTVAELRSQLSRDFRINPATETIRLIYRGRLLQDANALHFYGIEDGSTVHVVVQSRPADDASSGSAASAPLMSDTSSPQQQQQQQQQPGFGAGSFPWSALRTVVSNTISAAIQQQQQQQQPRPNAPTTPNTPPSTPSTPAGASSDRSGRPSAAPPAQRRPSVTITADISSDDGPAADGNSHAPPSRQRQLGDHLSSFISNAISNAMNQRQPPQTPQMPQAPPSPQSFRAVAEAARAQAEAAREQADRLRDMAATEAAEAGRTAREQARAAREEAHRVREMAKAAAAQAKEAARRSAEFFYSTAPPPAASAKPQTVLLGDDAGCGSGSGAGGGAYAVAPAAAADAQPPTVVHLHVHCTPEELGQMPARLRALAAQLPVSRVEMHAEPLRAAAGDMTPPTPPCVDTPTTTTTTSTTSTESPSSRSTQSSQPRCTPAQPPAPAGEAAGRHRTWVGEALQTATTSFGYVELGELYQGSLQSLARLREPLQQQLQDRLDGAGDTATALMELGHTEAQELAHRIVQQPRIRALIDASGSAPRYATVFERELPNFLEHLLLSLMLHIRQTSPDAMEWASGLRRLIVRYMGMAMHRAAVWFDGGSAAFGAAIAGALPQMTQAPPLVQPFLGFLSPLMQNLLSGWQSEYEATMQRANDAAVFEQVPASPQRGAAHLFSVAPPLYPSGFYSVPRSADGRAASAGSTSEVQQSRSPLSEEQLPATRNAPRQWGGVVSGEGIRSTPQSVNEKSHSSSSQHEQQASAPSTTSSAANVADTSSGEAPSFVMPSHLSLYRDPQPASSSVRSSDYWVARDAGHFGPSAPRG